MIQDIAPHRLWNQYDPSRKANPDSRVLCFREDRIFLLERDFPRLRDLPGTNPEELVFLFSMDQTEDYFLLEDPEDPLRARPAGAALPDGGAWFVPRELRGKSLLPREKMFALYTALQLSRWYRSNRFCGRCGARTFHDAKERAIRCACGHLIYPRVVPAVIVGVVSRGRLLVTKYRTGFAFFALIAGFAEIGETLEETVAREVMEEAGLRVRNIRYYKSQPWGIADDLLAGFWCEADGDDTIRMDPGELGLAEWRAPEDVELQPDDYSLTNEMMTMFKKGLSPFSPGAGS